MAATSVAAGIVLEVSQWDTEGDLRTVYITWQHPIPNLEKGDKLNIIVELVMDGKTYASHDVFYVLDIPKCPKCEGTIITVDGVTGVYYPLMESAELFGYSVLWAPKNERDGQVLTNWVHIAPKATGCEWIQVVETDVPEDNYKYYEYHYASDYDDQYWRVDFADSVQYIPKKDAVIMK